MLTEEFYPPLTTSLIPKNMGALLVPSTDIEAWLTHQQQQKGERLLYVADVLRDTSSGNRIEKALLPSGKNLEKEKFQSEDTTGAFENNNDGDDQQTIEIVKKVDD